MTRITHMSTKWDNCLIVLSLLGTGNYVVFEGHRNYGNTKFPNRKYRLVMSNVGNPIWKFGVLKNTSKMGKVTSPTGKAILLVILFCFFLLFYCFDGYMWIIKPYNGKVLTVTEFYALKCRDGSKCTRTQMYSYSWVLLEYSVLVLEYFLQTAISTHTSTRVLWKYS